MRILLVAATSAEIGPAIEYFHTEQAAGTRHQLEWKTTGIGLVCSTYTLAKRIENERPDLIIQAGIAGSFAKAPLAQVVVVAAEAIADLGVMEAGLMKNMIDLGFQHADEHPYREGWFKNPYQRLMNLCNTIQVRGISVNEISTDKLKTAAIQLKYAPYVESMEGASLHFVCLMEKIPFIQLRAISNAIGERDKSKWMIKAAIASLNKHVIELITKLDEYDEDLFRV